MALTRGRAGPATLTPSLAGSDTSILWPRKLGRLVSGHGSWEPAEQPVTFVCGVKNVRLQAVSSASLRRGVGKKHLSEAYLGLLLLGPPCAQSPAMWGSQSFWSAKGSQASKQIPGTPSGQRTAAGLQVDGRGTCQASVHFSGESEKRLGRPGCWGSGYGLGRVGRG